MKKCIVCEKDLPPFDKKMPENIEGGTLDIDFGYGSDNDSVNGFGGRHFVFEAAICDRCFKKKKHLGNWVSIERTVEWKRIIVSEDIVYGT